jgi:integrase
LNRRSLFFIILTGKRKGKALKTTAVSATMHRLKAKTGIFVTGRKLRHYFATEGWKGGWGIEIDQSGSGPTEFGRYQEVY